jgi:hypothetical protein
MKLVQQLLIGIIGKPFQNFQTNPDIEMGVFVEGLRKSSIYVGRTYAVNISKTYTYVYFSIFFLLDKL